MKKKVKSHLFKNNESNLNRYEQDYRWKNKTIREAEDVRTTVEMMAFLEGPYGKNVELDARVMAYKDGSFGMRNLNKKGFIESFLKNDKAKNNFRETFNNYSDFARGGIGGGFANTVGQDFTPLLGGPFYKQLYYYNDWLKHHQDSFYAYHHDPFGKAAVNILVDFTLGKGFSVDFENEVMQALWDSFVEVNDFQEMFRNYAKELSAYGENMLWKLPDNERYIVFPRTPKNLEDVPHTFIPRLRIIDPSSIVEVITYPEDVTRVLAYVWLSPSQFQTYTAKDEKTGQVVSSTKLIYQQIPAHQIFHHKVNSVSNEKMGRSDLFAALPYFKRLRDSVNYEIIAQQKNASWAIDTTIEGTDEDLAAYIADQQAQGTIPNAGSEFVHTKAITRQYLANQGAARNVSNAFDWNLSMIAASTGIPVSYFGTHLSGGQTRASALVATEPVAKRFEMRQQVYKKIISDVAKWLMQYWGIKSEFKITFPEIITQDRSAKLKDIYMAEQAKWISPERAADMAAIELAAEDYNWKTEQEKIKAQKEEEIPEVSANPLGGSPNGLIHAQKPSAITKDERKAIADNE